MIVHEIVSPAAGVTVNDVPVPLGNTVPVPAVPLVHEMVAP